MTSVSSDIEDHCLFGLCLTANILRRPVVLSSAMTYDHYSALDNAYGAV